MADLRVDMDLGTGANDGTSWANAYQGKVGFASAVTAQTIGETIYVKDTVSSTDIMTLAGLSTVAALTNPPRCIGVVTGASDTILKADIQLGHREGDSTKAYANSESPPNITASGTGDITINGSFYFYAFIFEAQDNFFIGTGDSHQHQTYEECQFTPGASASDTFFVGATNSTQPTHRFTFINCLFSLGGAVELSLQGAMIADFFNCEFTGSLAGQLQGISFGGIARFYNCDFTGMNATLVELSGLHGGTIEFHNCRMPAEHILTTGTATGLWTVANYGSEDTTGLTTSGSEQALEIHTREGTVELETIIVRTGGATDLAAGLFAYKVVANNVSENFAGVEVPLRDIWVEGDGAAKTYKVHIANSLAESSPTNDLHDSECYLRISSPSAAGLSRYDHLPDEGAPGDDGGKAQLLGTPADLTSHAGTTWATNGNNEQEILNSIAPDYEGVIHGTLIVSSERGSLTVYVDPLPVVT